MTIEKNKIVQLGIDIVRDNVVDYSVAEADEVIRGAFVKILGTDKPDHRLIRKHKDDIYEVVEQVLDEVLDSGWIETPFFKQFVEYRNLELGDTNEFYVEDKTMLTIAKLAEGHWNLRRQRLDIGESFAVSTSVYGAKVSADFIRFITKRISWATLVAKIQEAMQLKLATEIYVTFMGSMSYLPAEFKHTGSLSEDKMLDIIEHVRISNNYAPIVIAGTRKALRQLHKGYQGTNSFLVSDSMKNNINKMGHLETWEGHTLLEIPQVHNGDTFDFMLDDNRLMVLSSNTKPIKVIKEGTGMIRETNDGRTNMDMSIDHTYLTRYGIVTIFNNAYGMYELVI